MRISMWVLADWLKDFNPIIKIQSGKQILRNVRLLTETSKTDTYNVYIGDAGDYFSENSSGAVCVSGNDMILINDFCVEDIFNEILNAFDYYNEWYYSLHEKIEEGCSLQNLIDLSANVLKGPIIIAGASHEILAISSKESFTDNPDPLYDEIINNKMLPLNVISKLNQDLHGKQHLESPYYFESPIFKKPSLHKNIFNAKEHVGFLIMEQINNTFSSGDWQLFNTFGDLISSWMLNNFTKEKPTPQSEIFLNLLNENYVNDSSLLTKMNYIDWFQSDEKYLIKIMAVTNNERIYKALKNKIQQTFSGCYILLYDFTIILIINTNIIKLSTMLDEIADLLKQSQTYCGISYPFHDIKNIKYAYEQSGIALQFGSKFPGTVNFCKDYALLYVKRVLQENLKVEIKHQSLKLLIDYDLKNATDYYETLWHYLHNERNQTRTSEIMNIHRNTLVYRINRIEELIDVDLSDSNIRDHILLSYFLDK